MVNALPVSVSQPPRRRSPMMAQAIRVALAFGLLASGALHAQDTGTTPQTQGNDTSDTKAKTLQAVTVTGSLIRRVDLETANPVTTIDSGQIAASGKPTLGDLMQSLPSVAGNATNPSINSGGGTGASTVSLRGLGDNRTLVLVNGHRVAYNDVNSIPSNMIERVEVLTDGASSIYGSDAIGGVVNFILKDHYQGVQVSADYGESSHSDGNRRSFNLLAGLSGARAKFIVSITHQTQNPIASGARDYSAYTLAFRNGQVVRVGSSATPTGLIQNASGTNVTLNSGVNGITTLADYHPYNSATDSYNYAPYNLLLTPQDRTNISLFGSYKVTPDVEAYFNLFYTRTSASSIIAPVPIFANSDDFFIPSTNYYNPFGLNFGTDRTTGNGYNDFDIRLTSLGNRTYVNKTYDFQFTPGLRGNFGDSSWQWNVDFNYGKVRQKTLNNGFLDYSAFEQAIGPSFLSGNGVVTCGTPSAPIANCTPINIFNPNDPASVAALRKLVVNPDSFYRYTLEQFEIGANGELFDLPAGAVNLAAGLSYRRESQSDGTDTPTAIALNNGPYAGLCGVVEFCATQLSGSYNVKEAYGELFVPVLADLPFAHSLNIDIGSRFSRYSLSGTTTNSKVALEWKPVADLLVRGTASQVFRAPDINELFAGTAGGADAATDICNGYTGGHPQACANVPTDGSFQQSNPQLGVRGSGSVAAGYDLKPEYGHSFDYGMVYDPHWLPGLSLSADAWRIQLRDTIVDGLDPTTILNECYYSDRLCSLIHRAGNGQISYISLPTVNLGETSASGIDSTIQYNFNAGDYGKFNLSLASTYMQRYDVDTAPGDSAVPVTHCAGSYCSVYGEFPRWRGLATLNWNKGPWSASWTMRYVGRTRVGSTDLSQGYSADENIPGIVHAIGAYVYHNISGSYTLAKYHTTISAGIDNLSDKQPPMFYQWGSNGNTDAYTYDLIGRYYWMRATVSF
ncbi:TonB-dependent receptor [Dyella nitratireducens]|uniref:TonB-dependent receptor n=1 Tax=Dyella nitratireducens TaxID=1849580 RepID=A0ABQ1FZG0_9GAMM|nr:TonB-dependent receptor [Dyella nitratireducens]GGA33833.1 TonB-dependent receptor [Dyella nitratireducens]GLQ40783.1 TonB-dependent receptor [Dyella nitratireducens]